jgi:hypothetical protein
MPPGIKPLVIIEAQGRFPMQRVVYMLDRGIKGVTGLSPAIVPKAMEWPQSGSPNDLIGKWRIDYRIPCQVYPPPGEGAQRSELRARPAPVALALEAEIAALLAEAGDSLRQVGNREGAAWERPRGPADRRAKAHENTATSSKNVDIRVNELRGEPPPHPDIRIDDRERAVKAAAPPRTQATSTVVAVLLSAVGIGWIVGVPPSFVDRIVFSPFGQKADTSPSGQIREPRKPTALGGEGPNRDTNSGIIDTKGVSAASSHARGHRPGYLRNAAQQPNVIKTSAAAQQNTRTSDLATSSVGRRPKYLPDAIPFPETKPDTIEGWTVRDVFGGTAILEGPDGTWRAARGDAIPRVGTVESIVRWGNRWIVVTNAGLISTP